MEKVRKPTKKERIIRNITGVVMFICIIIAVEGINTFPLIIFYILYFTALISGLIAIALGRRIVVYDLLYSEPFWLRWIRWIKKNCGKK